MLLFHKDFTAIDTLEKINLASVKNLKIVRTCKLNCGRH